MDVAPWCYVRIEGPMGWISLGASAVDIEEQLTVQIFV